MKVSVIGGSGYIGLVTGIGLASLGISVICADINISKIQGLNEDRLPIHEEGLSPLLAKAKRKKKIVFTTSLSSAIKQSNIIFIAVGTPLSPNGEADMSQVLSALRTIAEHMETPKTIVIKSTVPVGTHKLAHEIIKKHLKNKNLTYDLVSNPEFLREGSAVKDFLSPDRIVIGSDSKKAIKRLECLYKTFSVPKVITDPTSAEMIKYACNAYLATRLSFINEMSEICEKMDASILNVIEGMKYDKRIGGHYLNPGPGFGGPCLNKDLQSLIRFSTSHGANTEMLQSVITRNNRQIDRIIEYIIHNLKSKSFPSNPKITILGLSFKANTNDTRNSPTLKLLQSLKKINVKISVYDPVVKKLPDTLSTLVHHASNPYSAVENSSLCILMTEWDEFKSMDLQSIYNLMAQPHILDTRNILSHEMANQIGFYYKATGCKESTPNEIFENSNMPVIPRSYRKVM